MALACTPWKGPWVGRGADRAAGQNFVPDIGMLPACRTGAAACCFGVNLGLKPGDMGKAAFRAEPRIDPVSVHTQITGVGADISVDKAGRFKDGQIGIFDPGDVFRLDLDITLYIQQRLAQSGPFSAHDVAQGQFEVVEAF